MKPFEVLPYWGVLRQQNLASIIHSFLATYRGKAMEWIRRRIRQLLGRCIGAVDGPRRPLDEQQEHNIYDNIELASINAISLPPSENYPHEDSFCTVIPVSEELMPPDHDHDRPTIMVECTAAASDDNLSYLPAGNTVVDRIPMQCSDIEFYTLTGTASPSVFTGLVSVKHKMNFLNQSTLLYEAMIQETEHVHSCEPPTSVKTNDCAQHVSTSSDAMHSLQIGDPLVPSVHEVALPQRSLTNHGIKCPLSNVNIVSRKFDHNGGTITSRYGDLRISIPEDAIGVGDVVVICTATSLYGPYNNPVHSQTDLTMVNVVSPYYWIGVSGSYHFHKKVQVEFEYFGACDPSHHRLLCCEDYDESCTMRPVDYELSFLVRDNILWCSFQIYHCCSYCLLHDCKDHVGLSRIVALYLKPTDLWKQLNFTVEIWFSCHISYCLNRCRELYTAKGMVLDRDCSCIFSSSSDKTCENYFDLSYDQIVGWQIYHLQFTKVKTKEVNFCNCYTNVEDLRRDDDNSLFPPRFILNVTKICGCSNELNSKIKVTLFNIEETKSVDSVFKLFVPISPSKSYSTTNGSGRSCPIPSHQCEYNKPKLPDLIRYSSKILRYWEDIAVLLGIQDKITAIDIENRAESKCRDMFTFWLERAVNSCWCHFVKALHGVGLYGVAEEVVTNIVRLPVSETVHSSVSAVQEEFIPAKKLKLLESESVPTSDLKFKPAQSHLELHKSTSMLQITASCISEGSSKIANSSTVGLNSIAGETEINLLESKTAPSGINSSITEAQPLLKCVSDTDNVRMPALDASEDTSKSIDETLNLDELVRYLIDIPEHDLIYFTTRLLPKDKATEVIKDIRRNGGSKEDKVNKICKAFLQKDPSWKKIYCALKETNCDDLADFIEACFFPVEDLPSS